MQGCFLTREAQAAEEKRVILNCLGLSRGGVFERVGGAFCSQQWRKVELFKTVFQDYTQVSSKSFCYAF
jgi:hypothetical protein